MPEAIHESAHALLQKGEDMRVKAPTHASPKRDLTNVYDTCVGNKLQSDKKRVKLKWSVYKGATRLPVTEETT